MAFYLFCVAAALSFVGFFLHSYLRNGHGMTYSGVLTVLWVGGALWSGGYLNG